MSIRRSFVFATLLAVCLAPMPIPGQTPDKPPPQSKQIPNVIAPSRNIPTSAPPAAIQNNAASTLNQSPTGQEKAINTREPVTITKLPSVSVERDWIDYLTLLFTFGLMVAGFVGIIAAIRTLRAIERQAHLMQEQNIEAREANAQATTFAHGNLRALEAQGILMARQADLMQAQLSQWVIVDRWDSKVAQTGGPLSRAPKILEISFSLTNESNFPMTVEFDFRFFGRLPNAANIITPYPIPLLPKSPEWFSLHLYPTPEQADAYLESGLTISVHGNIVHTGVSGQRSPLMELHGNLVCKTNQTFMDKRSIRLIERKPDQTEAN